MKEKISFEQFCDPAFRRQEQMKEKSEVLWLASLELDGLINLTKFARRYFNKTHGWFSQKLHANNVCGKNRAFTEEEFAKMANGFRDMAKMLNTYADALDAASITTEDKARE